MKPGCDKDDDDDVGRSRPAIASTARKISIVDDSIDSRELFIGTREIAIAHGGETYRLRLTAQNRLILTK